MTNGRGDGPGGSWRPKSCRTCELSFLGPRDSCRMCGNNWGGKEACVLLRGAIKEDGAHANINGGQQPRVQVQERHNQSF